MTLPEGMEEPVNVAPVQPKINAKKPGRATKKKRTAFLKYLRANRNRSLTNAHLADLFDVTERTIYRWREEANLTEA